MYAHPAPPVRVSVSTLPPVARFNLRISPCDLAEASRAFGLNLPDRIKRSVSRKDRAAWCLGPDEWLLHGPQVEQAAIVAAFAAMRASVPHSLTVISDREITIGISGPGAVDLLSVGIPIDLAHLPPGTGQRTVFDCAQVVLIRDGAQDFRVEVRRSFFPYVRERLETARAELTDGC